MNQRKDDEQPEFFVSRRGRQVGLHEVDLKGIDVEADKPSVAVPTKKPVKHTSTTPKTPRSRRKTMLIIAIIAAVLLIPVAGVELVAAQYRAAGAAARDDLNRLVTHDVLPLQKKTDVSADSIHGVAAKVDGITAKMCRGGLLDNAAGLYPRAKTALEQCKASQRRFAALSGGLFTLESQARYLERLGSVVQPVTTPITDEYAVVAAQQSAWQEASEKLAKLSPPTAMSAAHDDLHSHVSAVAKAWSELNTANNDQDADTFTEAEKTLATEYEAVRSSSEQFSAVLRDTQARVTAAYAVLK